MQEEIEQVGPNHDAWGMNVPQLWPKINYLPAVASARLPLSTLNSRLTPFFMAEGLSGATESM